MAGRILVASAQEDFDFPLAEAARKQIFAQALRYREYGSETEIMIVSRGRSSEETINGIPIRVIPRHRLPAQLARCRRFDTLHFFGTTGLIALAMSFQMPFRTRYLTVTDGGVFSLGQRAGLRRSLARLLPAMFDRMFVYTEHQRSILEHAAERIGPRIERVQPILPEVETEPSTRGEAARCILYMGHLSRFKGVDIVEEVFRRLAPIMPDLQLTLASNGLDYGDGCPELVSELMDEFPARVHLKGKVDPYSELRQASLLLHPLQQQAGTFAFPMTLYEALLCGTPFLSSDLDGLNEFFDPAFLCPPSDVDDFCERAEEILRSPGALNGTIAANLERIQAGSTADEADRIFAQS